MAGGVALVAAAGCGNITEAGGNAGNIEGRYVLTHHNADAVPATVHDDATWRETLESGTLDVDVGTDTTFTLTVVKTTEFVDGSGSDTSPSEFRGRLSLDGNSARLVVTEEDGEAGASPRTLAGDVRAGVVRVACSGEANLEVVSFRRK